MLYKDLSIRRALALHNIGISLCERFQLMVCIILDTRWYVTILQVLLLYKLNSLPNVQACPCVKSKVEGSRWVR